MIDLLKFQKPQQYPQDEIVNENDRLVRSWASVEVKDKQGDIVPVEELKRILNTWFKRGAVMIDEHSNRPIGRGLHWDIQTHPQTGTDGIVLDWQVFDDYSVDDQVWEEIKQGKRNSLSIGGRAMSQPEIKEDYQGNVGQWLRDMEVYEISPVENAANPLANNMAVNYLAKSQDQLNEFERKLLQDLQKGYVVKEMDEAYGGFQSKNECQEAQKQRGHTEDSAERICQFLAYKTENGWRDPEKGINNKRVNMGNKTKQGKEVKKPFAGYNDFESCVQANRDAENPEAYCAQIHYEATGEWPAEKGCGKPHKKETKKQEEPEDQEWMAQCKEVADGFTDNPDDFCKWLYNEGKTEGFGPQVNSVGKGDITVKAMKNLADIHKRRVYLKPGQDAPSGANVQEGPHGGRYYDTEDMGGQQEGEGQQEGGQGEDGGRPEGELSETIDNILQQAQAEDVTTLDLIDGNFKDDLEQAARYAPDEETRTLLNDAAEAHKLDDDALESYSGAVEAGLDHDSAMEVAATDAMQYYDADPERMREILTEQFPERVVDNTLANQSGDEGQQEGEDQGEDEQQTRIDRAFEDVYSGMDPDTLSEKYDTETLMEASRQTDEQRTKRKLRYASQLNREQTTTPEDQGEDFDPNAPQEAEQMAEQMMVDGNADKEQVVNTLLENFGDYMSEEDIRETVDMLEQEQPEGMQEEAPDEGGIPEGAEGSEPDLPEQFEGQHARMDEAMNEMQELQNEDIDDSDIEGIAMRHAANLLNGNPSELTENPETRDVYSDIQDTLIGLAHGQMEPEEAMDEIYTRANDIEINDSSQDQPEGAEDSGYDESEAAMQYQQQQYNRARTEVQQMLERGAPQDEQELGAQIAQEYGIPDEDADQIARDEIEAFNQNGERD